QRLQPDGVAIALAGMHEAIDQQLGPQRCERGFRRSIGHREAAELRVGGESVFVLLSAVAALRQRETAPMQRGSAHAYQRSVVATLVPISIKRITETRSALKTKPRVAGVTVSPSLLAASWIFSGSGLDMRKSSRA